MHAINRLLAAAIVFALLTAIAQQPRSLLATGPANWPAVTADIT